MKNVMITIGMLCFMLFASNTYGQDENGPQLVSYYFVELVPNLEKDSISPTESQKILNAHLQNIKDMAQQGKLLLAGPFADGGGLFILDAKSKEEAMAWVLEDPAVKAEVFDFNLRKWFTEKGMLSLENRDE